MSLETFDWKGYLQYIGYPEDQIPDTISNEELLDIRRHWAQTVYQEELAAAQDDPFLETPKERREHARDVLLAAAPEFRSEFGLRDPQPAEKAFSAQEFHDWVVNNEYQDGNLDFYLKTFAASRINKNTKYEYPYLEGLTKKEFQDMFMEQNGIDPDLTTIEDIRNGNFGPAAMAQRAEEESNLPKGSAMRQGWLEFKKLTGLTTETFGDFLGVEWMRNIGRGITENAIKTIDEEGYRGKYQESLVDTIKNEGIFAGAGKVLQMAQENWATTGVPLALAGMSAMFGIASRNPRLAAQSLASARASLAAATSADVAMGTGAAATVGRVGASTIAKSLAFASAMASGLEVGAVREELEQKGKEEGRQLYDPNDPGDAVAWGLLSAALDHVGNMGTFIGGGGLIRAAKGLVQSQQTRMLEAASAAARQATREAGKSWGRKIVEAMGIEGVTESLQELPAIMAARNKGVEYTPKEIRDRMIDAGVVGAFMGGGVRSVQSIPETLRERARRTQSETTQTPATSATSPAPPTNVPSAPNQPPPPGFDEKLAWNTNFAEIDNGNGWAAWDGYNVGYGNTKEEASQALLDQSNANKDQISGTPTSTANESRISFGNGGELIVTGNGHQGVIKRIIDLHNSNDNYISLDGTRTHTFDATALFGLNEKDFRKHISENWGNTTLPNIRSVRQARVDQVDIGINFDAEIRDNNGNIIGHRAELDLNSYRDQLEAKGYRIIGSRFFNNGNTQTVQLFRDGQLYTINLTTNGDEVTSTVSTKGILGNFDGRVESEFSTQRHRITDVGGAARVVNNVLSVAPAIRAGGVQIERDAAGTDAKFVNRKALEDFVKKQGGKIDKIGERSITYEFGGETMKLDLQANGDVLVSRNGRFLGSYQFDGSDIGNGVQRATYDLVNNVTSSPRFSERDVWQEMGYARKVGGRRNVLIVYDNERNEYYVIKVSKNGSVSTAMIPRDPNGFFARLEALQNMRTIEDVRFVYGSQFRIGYVEMVTDANGVYGMRSRTTDLVTDNINDVQFFTDDEIDDIINNSANPSYNPDFMRNVVKVIGISQYTSNTTTTPARIVDWVTVDDPSQVAGFIERAKGYGAIIADYDSMGSNISELGIAWNAPGEITADAGGLGLTDLYEGDYSDFNPDEYIDALEQQGTASARLSIEDDIKKVAKATRKAFQDMRDLLSRSSAYLPSITTYLPSITTYDIQALENSYRSVFNRRPRNITNTAIKAKDIRRHFYRARLLQAKLHMEVLASDPEFYGNRIIDDTIRNTAYDPNWDNDELRFAAAEAEEFVLRLEEEFLSLRDMQKNTSITRQIWDALYPGQGGMYGSFVERIHDQGRDFRFSRDVNAVRAERNISILDELSRHPFLGQGALNDLIESGKLVILSTQQEIESALIRERGYAPHFSELGNIQGFASNDNQRIYLSEWGIKQGDAFSVLLHEFGVHVKYLGFTQAQFQEILAGIRQNATAQTSEGRWIRLAIQKVESTNMKRNNPYFWEEVAAYLVEHSNEYAGLGILDRMQAWVKRWLFTHGYIDATNFHYQDFAIFSLGMLKDSRIPFRLMNGKFDYSKHQAGIYDARKFVEDYITDDLVNELGYSREELRELMAAHLVGTYKNIHVLGDLPDEEEFSSRFPGMDAAWAEYRRDRSLDDSQFSRDIETALNERINTDFIPQGIQKEAGVRYPNMGEEISNFRYSIGKKAREEYRVQLERGREDLSPEQIENILKELDKYHDAKQFKKVKAALHWVITGRIILPEDEGKVNDAIQIAENAKVDLITNLKKYESPLDFIEEYKEYKPKSRPIDPDTVPEFSDPVNLGSGIITYLVRDDKKGQQAMREVINTHWGEDANPWCLLQGDGKGNLTENSYIYWSEEYTALPKRVAFKNGNLISFMAVSKSDLDIISAKEEVISSLGHNILGNYHILEKYVDAYPFIADLLRVEEFVQPLSEYIFDIQYSNDDIIVRLKDNPALSYAAKFLSPTIRINIDYDDFINLRTNEEEWLSAIKQAEAEYMNRNEDLYNKYENWLESNFFKISYDDDNNTARIVDGNGDNIGQPIWMEYIDVTGNFFLREDGAYYPKIKEQWWDRKDKSHPNLDWARDPSVGRLRYSLIGEIGAARLDAYEEATTRLDNLAVAREMEAAGKDAKAVKLATGWERGKDGKWRYEIDDSGYAIKDWGEQPKNGIVKLGDVLDAPELFNAYPQFRVMNLEFSYYTSGNLGRYHKRFWADGKPRIEVQRGFWGDARGTIWILRHEIQHAIQDIEGFAKGGSLQEALDALPPDSPRRSERQDRLQKSIAGESEAFNVQRRADMTAEQRRASLASETEDVAREDQIVLEEMLNNVASSLRYSRTTTEEEADAILNNQAENGLYGDIRYSRITDENQITEYESELAKGRVYQLDENGREVEVPLYRAMVQWEDGSLHSPMAEIIAGQTVSLYEGDWERADEFPNLVIKTGKNKGKFPLKKVGENKSVYAAYAPFLHSSLFPLNDQFYIAYRRPLVIVQMAVPASELNVPEDELSKSTRDLSEKRPGMTEWNAGTVASKLGGRNVMLSRYGKIERILQDSEVAKIIADKIREVDKDIVVPINVVHKGLLRELVREGIKIGDVVGRINSKDHVMLTSVLADIQENGVNAAYFKDIIPDVGELHYSIAGAKVNTLDIGIPIASKISPYKKLPQQLNNFNFKSYNDVLYSIGFHSTKHHPQNFINYLEHLGTGEGAQVHGIGVYVFLGDNEERRLENLKYYGNDGNYTFASRARKIIYVREILNRDEVQLSGGYSGEIVDEINYLTKEQKLYALVGLPMMRVNVGENVYFAIRTRLGNRDMVFYSEDTKNGNILVNPIVAYGNSTNLTSNLIYTIVGNYGATSEEENAQRSILNAYRKYRELKNKKIRFRKNERKFIKDFEDILKFGEISIDEIENVDKGQQYKLNIPDVNTEMLQENKLMSEHSEYILEIIKKFIPTLRKENIGDRYHDKITIPYYNKLVDNLEHFDNMTGRDFYKNLGYLLYFEKHLLEHGEIDAFGERVNIFNEINHFVLTEGTILATKALREIGVKGIHYYGIRDRDCAVVFDGSDIEILETYFPSKRGIDPDTGIPFRYSLRSNQPTIVEQGIAIPNAPGMYKMRDGSIQVHPEEVPLGRETETAIYAAVVLSEPAKNDPGIVDLREMIAADEVLREQVLAELSARGIEDNPDNEFIFGIRNVLQTREPEDLTYQAIVDVFHDVITKATGGVQDDILLTDNDIAAAAHAITNTSFEPLLGEPVPTVPTPKETVFDKIEREYRMIEDRHRDIVENLIEVDENTGGVRFSIAGCDVFLDGNFRDTTTDRNKQEFYAELERIHGTTHQYGEADGFYNQLASAQITGTQEVRDYGALAQPADANRALVEDFIRRLNPEIYDKIQIEWVNTPDANTNLAGGLASFNPVGRAADKLIYIQGWGRTAGQVIRSAAWEASRFGWNSGIISNLKAPLARFYDLHESAIYQELSPYYTKYGITRGNVGDEHKVFLVQSYFAKMNQDILTGNPNALANAIGIDPATYKKIHDEVQNNVNAAARDITDYIKRSGSISTDPEIARAFAQDILRIVMGGMNGRGASFVYKTDGSGVSDTIYCYTNDFGLHRKPRLPADDENRHAHVAREIKENIEWWRRTFAPFGLGELAANFCKFFLRNFPMHNGLSFLHLNVPHARLGDSTITRATNIISRIWQRIDDPHGIEIRRNIAVMEKVQAILRDHHYDARWTQNATGGYEALFRSLGITDEKSLATARLADHALPGMLAMIRKNAEAIRTEFANTVDSLVSYMESGGVPLHEINRAVERMNAYAESFIDDYEHRSYEVYTTDGLDELIAMEHDINIDPTTGEMGIYAKAQQARKFIADTEARLRSRNAEFYKQTEEARKIVRRLERIESLRKYKEGKLRQAKSPLSGAELQEAVIKQMNDEIAARIKDIQDLKVEGRGSYKKFNYIPGSKRRKLDERLELDREYMNFLGRIEDPLMNAIYSIDQQRKIIEKLYFNRQLGEHILSTGMGTISGGVVSTPVGAGTVGDLTNMENGSFLQYVNVDPLFLKEINNEYILNSNVRDSVIGGVIDVWKANNTIYSIKLGINNYVGNFSMLLASGHLWRYANWINAGQITKRQFLERYTDNLEDMNQFAEQVYEEMRDNRVVGGTMSEMNVMTYGRGHHEKIFSMLVRHLRDANILSNQGTFRAEEWVNNFLEKMKLTYAFGDEWVKPLMYLNNRANAIAKYESKLNPNDPRFAGDIKSWRDEVKRLAIQEAAEQTIRESVSWENSPQFIRALSQQNLRIFTPDFLMHNFQMVRITASNFMRLGECIKELSTLEVNNERDAKYQDALIKEIAQRSVGGAMTTATYAMLMGATGSVMALVPYMFNVLFKSIEGEDGDDEKKGMFFDPQEWEGAQRLMNYKTGGNNLFVPVFRKDNKIYAWNYVRSSVMLTHAPVMPPTENPDFIDRGVVVFKNLVDFSNGTMTQQLINNMMGRDRWGREIGTLAGWGQVIERTMVPGFVRQLAGVTLGYPLTDNLYHQGRLIKVPDLLGITVNEYDPRDIANQLAFDITAHNNNGKNVARRNFMDRLLKSDVLDDRQLVDMVSDMRAKNARELDKANYVLTGLRQIGMTDKELMQWLTVSRKSGGDALGRNQAADFLKGKNVYDRTLLTSLINKRKDLIEEGKKTRMSKEELAIVVGNLDRAIRIYSQAIRTQ